MDLSSPLLAQASKLKVNNESPSKRDQVKRMHPYALKLILQGRKKEAIEYLEKISELYSVTGYDNVTGDEFQIHLFIELADSHMQKIATQLWGTDNPTMEKLKVKVKETENATWYNQKREYGKMANLRKDK